MRFLKDNKRFSFHLGNENAWDLEYESHAEETENTLTTTYSFEGGLKVTNIAKKYEKFGAYEWVNYIENTSDTPTEIVSELWDCNCTLPLEHEDPRKREAYLPDKNIATKIYVPTGSTCTKDEFFSDADVVKKNRRIHHIYADMSKSYAASGGLSSENNAPFFNVHKNGKGYIFAIGWSGQWNCEIERTKEDITFKSKIENTYFRVMPGEKFRTSSVVILPYEGDVTASQNKWRRLVKEHFSLIGTKGRDAYGPLCAGIWGGMSTASVLDRIEKIKNNHLPFEYVWMDAGWYGGSTLPTPDEFGGDWPQHVGDWRVSPYIHPNGLKDVSKAVHDAGMKFLLWFEPERAVRTTPIALEHPEYFILGDTNNVRDGLLNLGNESAWKYCFDTLSNYIDALKIDCYRQDFNFSKIDLRSNDREDRQGISEIKHINGLYKLWDALLEKFPNLIIDNCAGGGRRIDIETLRRSMPLWRSDYQCKANYDIEASQCHHMTFNTWMPYSGTGTGRGYDEYRMRSAYDASMTVNHSFSERESFCDTKDKIDFIKKYTEEYVKVRPYFSEDFYPLTDFSDKVDAWCAVQFDRPSEKDGIVQIFRRENSPYETANFTLGGINETCKYLFTDIDGGEFTVSGKELTEEGLKISIPNKRTAKIYFYKSI